MHLHLLGNAIALTYAGQAGSDIRLTHAAFVRVHEPFSAQILVLSTVPS